MSDATGRELTRTTKTGTTARAAYTWTYNRAGLVLSETSTITGDVANGTIAYGYDPLGRLTGAGSTAYAWDATANRTGAGSATTAFDPANRPTSGTTPTAAYGSDADGRLTARPGQAMTYDHLGRLASVTTASGTTTCAYDPLDRLRTVSAPGGAVTRFRYTGLTTAAAQLIDDTSGTVTRDIANGWTAERLADWDPAVGTTSSRVYGTNAHHDTTWLAKDDGTVLASLRYDPWGVPRSTPAAGYTPFRFQGSWSDSSTDLAWVVTRWYAPALGTFISEDSLLGQPRDPDSRHLYAYAQGEPVGSWDPEGREAAQISFAASSPTGFRSCGFALYAECYGTIHRDIVASVDSTLGVRWKPNISFPPSSGTASQSGLNQIHSKAWVSRLPAATMNLRIVLNMHAAISAQGKLWEGLASHRYWLNMALVRTDPGGFTTVFDRRTSFHDSTWCYGFITDTYSDDGCLSGFTLDRSIHPHADFRLSRRWGDTYKVIVYLGGSVYYSGVGWAETVLALDSIAATYEWIQ